MRLCRTGHTWALWKQVYIYTVFGICSFGTMGTLLSCNKQIGWICLSLPWNQMGPHPLGVLLRGAFLASKWASHHTSRGDMYIIYIYIYIRTVGGYTQNYTYQSIRYVCTKYLNKYIYIYIHICGRSCWLIHRAIRV